MDHNDVRIKDESFVRKAFGNSGRWTANQSQFLGDGTVSLNETALEAVIGATNCYIEEGILPKNAGDEVLSIATVGEARNFIDKYHSHVLEYHKTNKKK